MTKYIIIIDADGRAIIRSLGDAGYDAEEQAIDIAAINDMGPFHNLQWQIITSLDMHL